MQTISTSVCSGRADRFSAIETIVVGLKKGVSHSRTSKPFKAYYYQVHSGQNYFSTNYNCRQNIDCKEAGKLCRRKNWTNQVHCYCLLHKYSCIRLFRVSQCSSKSEDQYFWQSRALALEVCMQGIRATSAQQQQRSGSASTSLKCKVKMNGLSQNQGQMKALPRGLKVPKKVSSSLATS